MKQFEYRIMDARMWNYDRPSMEAISRELDEWGFEGLELVSVWKGYAFLKREVLEPSPMIAKAVEG